MKPILNDIKNHIKQNVTSLCSCWKITRSDGLILRFTDLDRDIEIAGEIYKSTDSYDRGVLKSSNNTDTDEMKITGVLSVDGFEEGDLRAGVLVEVLPEYRSIQLGIYVVYPSRKHLPPKVRVLVNFLVERFAQPCWEVG